MEREQRVGSLEGLRDRNRLRVVETLRRNRTASRADIARATGLSRSTVGTLVADLQARGLVVERAGEVPERGAGRPPVLLALDPSAGAALGLDFGHSHLTVAVADLSSTVLAEQRVDLDVDRAAGEALDAAAELAREVLERAGVPRENVIAAGMGLPGPVDRVSGVVGSSVILPGWAGLAARDEAAARLGLHVEVENDANLGALGEVTHGAGRGETDVVYVKVSNGIGAGLILGGRLHHGAGGVAGELGHVQVRDDGAICRCGNRGCLETIAAAPALLDLLRPSHGQDLTTADMLALARGGDLGSRRLLADAGRAVGRVLGDLCNHINPGMVIVGGDLAAAGAPLLDGIRESIDRYALPAAAHVRVEAATLGDRAEVLGALALVIGDVERLGAGLAAVAGAAT
ncbi:MAG TPA: ROK family transcriptional regulator [Solirubrobacteraceae bacterium]|nr:ROK family transcriptional regulator [Solirubrobacteraceae bacterium]